MSRREASFRLAIKLKLIEDWKSTSFAKSVAIFDEFLDTLREEVQQNRNGNLYLTLTTRNEY
jgi:hypothetical protein